MKTVLILVLSSDWWPYDMLTRVSMETWDSIDVSGCETIFYSNYSINKNTIKQIYLPIGNSLFDIGKKTLLAFEWALKNKKFDFIARPGANCYVNKRKLIEHIQTLPAERLFATLEVKASDTEEKWGWGHGIILSKDVVESLVMNKELWDHKLMEDVAMSRLVSRLGIEYYPATACSIDKLDDKWRCTCYNSTSFEFDDFSEIVKATDQFMFRCKQDYDRSKDEFVMKELFKYLQ